MSYNIIPTPSFKNDFKYYKKKYRRFSDDIEEVVEELINGNLVGDEVDHLGLSGEDSAYKVRIANSSANKGKLGGFRLLYYVIKNDSEIYLLTIYSKSDRENIPADEIRELIRKYCA